MHARGKVAVRFSEGHAGTWFVVNRANRYVAFPESMQLNREVADGGNVSLSES